MNSPDDDIVQFGCIRCKRTKRTKRIDAAAEKTMEAILMATFDLIHKEGADLGVDVPPELRDKLLKWGRKYSMIPPAPAAPPNTPVFRWD
jgi:hypothetical protein